MQQYISLFFLILIGMVVYYNNNNPKMMSIYSSLLLLVYLVYYKTQVEMFDSSLDIFYDTIKDIRPDNALNSNIANLTSAKSNDEIQNIFSGMQSLFLPGGKIKTHPISSCYNKILKGIELDKYSTFYISNNKQNIEIDYQNKRIYTNSPVSDKIKGTGHDNKGHDNKGQSYPRFIKNIPQKWIIKFIDRSIVKNGANGIPICSINIQSKSNHDEIPSYYLEYSGDKIQPSIYKGGKNQKFFIEKSMDHSGYMIKTINNKYLCRISEKYIDGNDYVGLRPKDMCDDSCAWDFKGVDKAVCKKKNETSPNNESCCSQYVLNKDGKCILPGELNKIGRFAKYFDSPTDIFNTRIQNITKDQKEQLGKGGWIDSYNNVWNGHYSNFLTLPNKYNINNSISVNIKTNKITERAHGSIVTSIKPHGSPIKFKVESLGSDILYGSDGKGTRIIAEMMPYDQIKDLFNIKLTDIGVDNIKGVEALRNTVLVKFLVFYENTVINIGSSNFDNLNIKSFKMTDKNLKNNLVSIFEIVNSMNKQ
tara:strand:- start:10523 stop:12124 length:1602 start_codon:yes stop_codon:yes gene_type:complete